MSFSTFSFFMVYMSSPNLEATNTGGRRLPLCVGNGTQLSAHRRRTSSASSVSGMTTARCSLGNFDRHRGIAVPHLLERSPLLALNLHYDLIRPPAQSSKANEEDIVVLLQHLERVYFLQLRLSLSTWRSIAAATGPCRSVAPA
jgi:hypothetical protein